MLLQSNTSLCQELLIHFYFIRYTWKTDTRSLHNIPPLIKFIVASKHSSIHFILLTFTRVTLSEGLSLASSKAVLKFGEGREGERDIILFPPLPDVLATLFQSFVKANILTWPIFTFLHHLPSHNDLLKPVTSWLKKKEFLPSVCESTAASFSIHNLQSIVFFSRSEKNFLFSFHSAIFSGSH